MSLDFQNLTEPQARIRKRLWPEVKGQYNLLIEKLLTANRSNIIALSSVTLTRNHYMSELFNNTLDLELLLGWLATEPCQEVVCRSPGQLKVVRTILDKNGFNTVKTRLSPTYQKPRVLYSLAMSMIHLMIQWFMIRLSVPAEKSLSQLSPITIFNTFIVPAMVTENGISDRYYKYFSQTLPDSEMASLRMLPTFSYFGRQSYLRLWRVLRSHPPKKSPVIFLFKESFLSLWDQITVVFKMATLPRLFVIPQDLGESRWDLTPIIQQELSASRFNYGSCCALTMYWFLEKISRTQLNLGCLVNWFENLPVDKMLNKGVADFFPQAKVVAHQGFATQRKVDFYVNPIPAEIEYNLCPRQFFVIGSALVSQAREFCQNLDVQTGPAFRFGEIHNIKLTTAPSPCFLVAMPYATHHIDPFAAALKDILNQRSDLHLIVKPHPIVPEYASRVAENLGLAVVEAPFYQALEGCHGVLFAGSSTTLIETVTLGIPAIVWEPKDEIIDLPSEIKHAVIVVQSATELLSGIQRILQDPQSFVFPTIPEFFCPVNKDTVADFFQVIRN